MKPRGVPDAEARKKFCRPPRQMRSLPLEDPRQGPHEKNTHAAQHVTVNTPIEAQLSAIDMEHGSLHSCT